MDEIKQSKEKQTLQNFEDLQNEIAGLDVGRQIRFGHSHNFREQNTKDEKDRQFAETLNALQRMLQIPGYAAAREEFGTFLSNAQQATETAMAANLKAHELAQKDFVAMQDNANRLPNGQLVFKDENGNVVTEDGQKISSIDAASIVWKDGAPTFEEYKSAQKKASETKQALDDLERYQHDVLAPAQDRFDDEDDPMTLDEFEDQKRRIEDGMPKNAESILNPQAETAISHQKTVEMTIRQL